MYDLAVKNNKFIHIAPRDLKKKHIDPKMRDICDRINKSDYCWTVFSCQGHFSGCQKGCLPYLVLLCVNDKRPYIFETLFKSFEIDAVYNDKFPLMGPSTDIMKISLGTKDKYFSYLHIYFTAMNKRDQDYVLKILDTFSRTL